MVNYRSVAAVLAVVTVAFAGLSGYLFLAPPSSPAQTITQTATEVSSFSTTILNTMTSTATAVVSSTTTLLNTITTTASTTLVSTATTTATATSTVTGPFTVNLAYKAGTGLYLTNATGFTLYFRETDPGNGTSTCTGSCVTVWPLFYAAPGSITVPPGLSASSFGVATRTDGKLQTTYNGYPLYFYENDKAPGQITGQAKGNFYPCCSVDATTSTSSSTSTTATTTTTTSTTTTSAVPAVVKVSIPSGTGSSSSLNFSPSTITVTIGVNNTVMWTNNDSVTHTITSNSVPTGAQSFDDESIAPGATFSVTFTVAGTYQYYCQIHPWMSGTIVVEP